MPRKGKEPPPPPEISPEWAAFNEAQLKWGRAFRKWRQRGSVGDPPLHPKPPRDNLTPHLKLLKGGE